MSDYSGNWPRWATIALGAAAAVAAVAVTVATLGAAAPAAACTLTMVGMSMGAGYAVASTAATVAVVATTVAAATYAGDAAYSMVTGDSLLLNTVFQGNADAYNAGLFVTNLATAGMLEMAAQSPGVCFVAGTLIATVAGHVAIEKIEAGDLVWATNPETNETELKQVVQTFVNETNELVHLNISGETITTTPTHPFYVPQKGWISAINLRAGDILVTVNGEYVILEQIQHEILEAPITVYNFEVEDFHTYYVSENAILVHNDCGNRGNLKKNMLKEGPAPGDKYQAHHGLPWADRKYFSAAGLDVNDARFGIWVKGGGNGGHQSWSYRYGQLWNNYIQSHPDHNATDIINYFNKLNGMR